MITTKVKSAAGAVLVLGILAASAAVHAYQAPPPAASRKNDQTVDSIYEFGGSDSQTYHRTYYVGDLVWHESATAESVGTGKRPKVDMAPLIDLITSTIAPKTWRITDVTGKQVDPDSPAAKKIGSITPFYLSLSLIVRHDGETHDKVSSLLRGLRRFHESCGKKEVVFLGPPTMATGEAAPATSVDVATRRAARNAELSPSGSTRRRSDTDADDRLRALVKEMHDEVELLIRENSELRQTNRPENPRK